MRIGFVSHTGVESGAELAMLRTLESVSDEFVPVAIVGSPGPIVDRLISGGIETHLYPGLNGTMRSRSALALLARVPTLVSAILQTRKLIRKLDLEGIVCNSLRSSLMVGPVAKASGVTVVWHVRDRLTRDYLSLPLLLLSRLGSLLIPSGIVANSSATLNTVWRRGATPVAVVNSPVEWLPRATEVSESFRLTHVGRISEWKGQDVFLKAFAKAFAGGTEVAQLVGAPLFGEEAYLESLHKLVDALGIARQVRFLGHRNDVPLILARRTDVLVHSSVIPEPFGQVVAQGLATGLPVIASHGGGPSEMIRDGWNGLLTRGGDVNELALAMLRLRHRTDLYAAVSERAQASGAAFRDPDRNAARVAEFVRTVVSSTGGRFK